MIKWGKRKGKQRWKCVKCNKVFLWKRKDAKERNLRKTFLGWLTKHDSLASIAFRKQKHRSTFSRNFKPFWDKSKQNIQLLENQKTVLILDGLFLSDKSAVLIAFDSISNKPLLWGFSARENCLAWSDLLARIKTAGVCVSGIVSDGQKGLISAVKVVFPSVPHQRCVIHIVRLSLAWLTKNPKTEAGVSLRKLVLRLPKISDKQEAKKWTSDCLDWQETFSSFLQEKSVNPLTGRKWHTHRRLRTVASLVCRALPNLFAYLDDPLISSTTNKVEGGINGPLSELLHRHRGLKISKQKTLISMYLEKRKKDKLPTKNAT